MEQLPLPIVEIDPRNEAELLSEAIAKVYEASGRRINDFTAGSPVSALLEGQVFAGGELLYYVNKLPAAFVMEWLARIFGIKISQGAKAMAQVRIRQKVATTNRVIPKGTLLRSTSGIAFELLEDVHFPVSVIEKTADVQAIEPGTKGNVPANTITAFAVRPANIDFVTNDAPATGGRNPESLDDALRRGFSYVNARTPVNIEDWIEAVEQFLGKGAPILIKNRHPYPGHITFWVLSQDGTPLSAASLSALSEWINLRKSVHYETHVYNCAIEPLTLTIHVQNADLDLLRASLQEQLRPSPRGLNQPGQPLSITLVKRAIYTIQPECVITSISPGPCVDFVYHQIAPEAVFDITLVLNP